MAGSQRVCWRWKYLINFFTCQFIQVWCLNFNFFLLSSHRFLNLLIFHYFCCCLPFCCWLLLELSKEWQQEEEEKSLFFLLNLFIFFPPSLRYHGQIHIFCDNKKFCEMLVNFFWTCETSFESWYESLLWIHAAGAACCPMLLSLYRCRCWFSISFMKYKKKLGLWSSSSPLCWLLGGGKKPHWFTHFFLRTHLSDFNGMSFRVRAAAANSEKNLVKLVCA